MTKQNVQMLSGNEACALAAIAAGARFFAGYPITPSSEIAEQLSYLLPRNGGRFIQRFVSVLIALIACLK